MKNALTSLRILTAVWLMAMLLPVIVAADELPVAATGQTEVNKTAVIKSVKLVTSNNNPELLLEASGLLTYSSYFATSPDRMVVDFAQTTADEKLSVITFEQAPVSKLTVKSYETEAGAITRMELFLAQNVKPVLVPAEQNKGEIRITFPGYNAAETATAENKIEKTVAVTGTLTNIVPYASGVDILVDGEFANYKTMRLNQPTRLVIDLYGVQAGSVDRFIQLKGDLLSTARIGTYPGRVRITLDTVDGFVPDAEYTQLPHGLRISFPTHKADDKADLSAPIETEPASVAAAAPESAPVATPAPVATSAPAPAPVAPKAAVVKPGQIEAIDFQVVDNISRISIRTSGAVEVGKPVKTPGFLSLPIKNAVLPRRLQRSFESKFFPSAVLRITPVQAKSRTGKEVIIRVALRSDAPYIMRSESDMLYLDIENPVVPVEKKTVETSLSDAEVAKDVETATAAKQVAATTKDAATVPPEVAQKTAEEPVQSLRPRYTGRRVTLEFADAEVGKILQLLAEISERNFIFGDDVGKQKVSMKLNNVPWDQALAIILENNNLDKYDEGNVTYIRKKGSFKSQREEEIELRKAIYQSEPLVTEIIEVNYSQIGDIKKQFLAVKKAYGDIGTIEEDERTGKIIITSIGPAITEMKKLHKELDTPERQVMIEARIVEASSNFTRSLGINWGVHYRDGSASIAGINSFDTSFGGLTSVAPPTTGVSGDSAGASAGISFGTLASNIKLDMRLNAAASAGIVRIVSTPKVATLNRKTAKITQGQQIPYTSSTSDKVETKFVEAALSLEVTPYINPNGTIVMKIDAKNDSPSSIGNPPQINKKQATTEMMLRDGETTVIGGIFVENESSGDQGVPFLQDIPLFGQLFKTKDVKRSRNELLIFITPRILSSMPNV